MHKVVSSSVRILTASSIDYTLLVCLCQTQVIKRVTQLARQQNKHPQREGAEDDDDDKTYQLDDDGDDDDDDEYESDDGLDDDSIGDEEAEEISGVLISLLHKLTANGRTELLLHTESVVFEGYIVVAVTPPKE